MANSKSKLSLDLAVLTQERLRRFVTPGQRICVALSGGVDSIALLHAARAAASKLPQRLVALHVNHGLSSRAEEWAAFCKATCIELAIPLEVVRVIVAPDGDGIEGAARKVRYAALEAFNCDWILLAHHREDQAETVLLNLLRGASVLGMAGMSERRGRFLRPFLDISRREIMDYARLQGLRWIEDESNGDVHYRRNFVRHEVFPLIRQSFPGATATLARAAENFADSAELLDDLAKADLGGESLLDVDRLRMMTPPRGTNLLRYYLGRHGLQVPSRATLVELLRQLVDARRDSQIRFSIGEHEVRRFRNRVRIDRAATPVQSVEWVGQDEIAWAGYTIRHVSVVGSGIEKSTLIGKPLCFVPRDRGGSIQLAENGPHRVLKDLLREAGVPPWRRSTLPLLYAGDELVWVPGVGIDTKYRCKPLAEGVLIEFDGVTW